MKNDGGPAFPANWKEWDHGEVEEHSTPGMSVRMWLAGLAMKGLLANANTAFEGEVDNANLDKVKEGLQFLACISFMAADAMIAESEKTDD